MKIRKEMNKSTRSELTTQDLIQELKTRGEGVSSFKANRGTLCYDITDDDTTIIVVKK